MIFTKLAADGSDLQPHATGHKAVRVEHSMLVLPLIVTAHKAPKEMNCKAAKKWAESLDINGWSWRLPTVEEAMFIPDRSKYPAIDKSFFAPSSNPLYLTGMAVHPLHQRKGIGRLCIEQARSIALRWPGDAIRLDAYDNQTGAGEFYRKCGFTEVGRARYREIPLIYFEMLLAPEPKGPAVRRAQK